jgi:methyl-accepting chemotaxis protein
MSNNMADGSNVGVITSIWSALGALIVVIGFWTKFVTDRISGAKEAAITAAAEAKAVAQKADAKADAALHETAEVKQEFRQMRETFEAVVREVHDDLEKARRESGENVAAIREHVRLIELHTRDHFAPKEDVADDINEIKTSVKELNGKFDQLTNLLLRTK